ncbi:ATP-binding cassette domain-containing protein [Cognatishimia sp. WU-CL00825]|uniref:ATP-binding cassette domain-containing protein n=1 Tax=Cognatishimia sp. WU-CL00825 TaxID=3127658 RepID=UPI003104E573
MVETLFPLLVRDIVVRKRKQRLLGPLSLQLDVGGVTMVMGPNGAGKSTLLKALHGMERLSDGQMQWNIGKTAARARQAFVFQTPTVMRRSTLDNVAYPLILQGIKRAKARQEAMHWLTQVGLAQAAQRRASVLSGGERQKMALARALIRKPELLFLDEPCANLDGRATREIEALLRQASAAGTRLIMATHDIGQARRLADDVLFIHKGALVEHSRATTFFDTPKSPQAMAYLNGDIIE